MWHKNHYIFDEIRKVAKQSYYDPLKSATETAVKLLDTYDVYTRSIGINRLANLTRNYWYNKIHQKIKFSIKERRDSLVKLVMTNPAEYSDRSIWLMLVKVAFPSLYQIPHTNEWEPYIVDRKDLLFEEWFNFIVNNEDKILPDADIYSYSPYRNIVKDLLNIDKTFADDFAFVTALDSFYKDYVKVLYILFEWETEKTIKEKIVNIVENLKKELPNLVLKGLSKFSQEELNVLKLTQKILENNEWC